MEEAVAVPQPEPQRADPVPSGDVRAAVVAERAASMPTLGAGNDAHASNRIAPPLSSGENAGERVQKQPRTRAAKTKAGGPHDAAKAVKRSRSAGAYPSVPIPPFGAAPGHGRPPFYMPMYPGMYPMFPPAPQGSSSSSGLPTGETSTAGATGATGTPGMPPPSSFMDAYKHGWWPYPFMPPSAAAAAAATAAQTAGTTAGSASSVPTPTVPGAAKPATELSAEAGQKEKGDSAHEKDDDEEEQPTELKGMPSETTSSGTALGQPSETPSSAASLPSQGSFPPPHMYPYYFPYPPHAGMGMHGYPGMPMRNFTSDSRDTFSSGESEAESLSGDDATPQMLPGFDPSVPHIFMGPDGRIKGSIIEMRIRDLNQFIKRHGIPLSDAQFIKKERRRFHNRMATRRFRDRKGETKKTQPPTQPVCTCSVHGPFKQEHAPIHQEHAPFHQEHVPFKQEHVPLKQEPPLIAQPHAE